MSVLHSLYGGSLALLTDLYELSMACAYFKCGMADREAAFSLSFRHCPFGGGYSIACGLEAVAEFLEAFRFEEDDVAFLRGAIGSDGKRLFDDDFLSYLRRLEFSCDVAAVPEGTLVFPREPLIRVIGPLVQAQLLETPLLNLVNFQTLIATKAARVCAAARGEPVLEFGLRRAQGIDGGLSASRAAYVGGCAATSNVLAGKLYGIPIRGTHAHSWVMAFGDELEAFQAYARAMPNNCVLLVDTYDTRQGVRNAITVGRELRGRGCELGGIRLDSGDLSELSLEARRLLDEAGFPDAVIIGSGNLDERSIEELKRKGAAIGVWGVGTKLATGYDEPALDGVYKLNAVREQDGRWAGRVKISDEPAKSSLPGLLQVRRFRDQRGFFADAICDELSGAGHGCTIVDPEQPERRLQVPEGMSEEDLLTATFLRGKRVLGPVSLDRVRARVQDQLASLPSAVRRLGNPAPYQAGVELSLYQRTQHMLRRNHP